MKRKTSASMATNTTLISKKSTASIKKQMPSMVDRMLSPMRQAQQENKVLNSDKFDSH